MYTCASRFRAGSSRIEQAYETVFKGDRPTSTQTSNGMVPNDILTGNFRLELAVDSRLLLRDQLTSVRQYATIPTCLGAGILSSR